MISTVFLAVMCFVGVSPSPAPSTRIMAIASSLAVDLPDTPLGRCAAAWFKLMASGDPDEARAFETTYRAPKRLAETPIEKRVARLPDLRGEFGTLTVTGVGTSSATSIALMVTSSARGAIEVKFEFDSDGKLDGIQIASGGPSAPSQPLSAERRAKLIAAACAAVRNEYVFPDQGERMAVAIEKAEKSGTYDAIADERQFADRLTSDLRAVTNDRHLGVGIMPASDERPHSTAFGPSDDEARRANWQFKSCEVAPGNVGVVRFDGFNPSDEAKTVVDATFAFLARCDALVFDIRANGGGSPVLLNYLAGYLFEKPTLLNTMMDRSGAVIGEGYSDETVAGQRFAADLPVFVVTSSRTFSCAEEFAYDLQSLKRATIVGETTGGGAHPIKPVRLDERMIIRMPYIRANNPITNTNWEGCGVKPDVEAPADKAIARAIELARVKIAERTKSP